MSNIPGTIALVGSGEFLPKSDLLDRALLGSLKQPARVVILPTASALDGDGVAEHWAEMGITHFERLGVTLAEAVMVRTREDANSDNFAKQIASANFVYLSGGKPSYLLQTLKDTKCWKAIRQVFDAGGIVAGCSAGAMVLGQSLPNLNLFKVSKPALNLAGNFVVIPHFDEIPVMVQGIAKFARQKAATEGVVGIEGATGLVGSGNEWRVEGSGGVTVFGKHSKRRYKAGERVIFNTIN